MPSSKRLAALCDTLGTMLGSGVSMRRAIEVADSQSGSAVLRRAGRDVSERIEQGADLAGALQAEDCFPPFFIELVRTGEQSGHLERAFEELGRFYALQARLKRRFLSGIVTPVLQYAAAVLIISLVSWFITGTSFLWGLALGYGVPVVVVLAGIFLSRTIRGGRALHELLLRVPAVRGVVRSLALARFSTVMRITLEAGFGMKECLERAFKVTQNRVFAARGPRAAEAVRGGATLTEALSQLGLFPRQYLEIVSVGEQSGKLSEQFERLSRQYVERSENGISALVTLAARIVWLLVVIILIYFIFRTFTMYYVERVSRVLG